MWTRAEQVCEFGAAWRDSGAPLTGLRQLAVSFQVPCLVGIVFQDDIGFRILEIAEANKNDVTLYHGGGTEKATRRAETEPTMARADKARGDKAARAHGPTGTHEARPHEPSGPTGPTNGGTNPYGPPTPALLAH